MNLMRLCIVLALAGPAVGCSATTQGSASALRTTPSSTLPVAGVEPNHWVPARSIAPTHGEAPENPTRDPNSVAIAWAIAANSVTYRDATPGQWTVRSAPFVTGPQAAAERAAREGGGGSTWDRVRYGHCKMSLRDLAAGTSREAPASPDQRVVFVSATRALTCASGEETLNSFAAQVMTLRVGGRWLVASVTY